MHNEFAVEVKNLYVEFKTDYGVVKAVNGLDISIAPGKTLGLVGETGAGKTTTGLAMMNLIPSPPGRIVQGEIRICGQDILKLSEREKWTSSAASKYL